MTKPDPIDALGAAYETMYERVEEGLKHAKEKTGPVLKALIHEAREKAVELDELTEEDAEKLARWLMRDLNDAIHHMAEKGSELKEWLGFEAKLVERSLVYKLLEAADKTTAKLLRMKEEIDTETAYHTGEITGPGKLICDECGEELHFHRAGKIPPCPKCHSTRFHREGFSV
ncbi:MAG TPA: hypothetical protein ENJ11_02285 [Gammaproteobacteria bacterium]|nr:hypothetical protein [Gammaproteobacteria bacterium]